VVATPTRHAEGGWLDLHWTAQTHSDRPVAHYWVEYQIGELDQDRPTYEGWKPFTEFANPDGLAEDVTISFYVGNDAKYWFRVVVMDGYGGFSTSDMR